MKLGTFGIVIIIYFLLDLVYSKNYRYYNYDEIWQIFKKLAVDCPRFIKLDTSQKRYNLPSAGKCGQNKDKPCENLIVFMTDYEEYDPTRPQIYFSGLLHGDEVIGATVLTELALYMCDKKNQKTWVVELLKKSFVVFTPFTNAYGYSNGIREDFVEYNSGSTGLVDPNRDFPYFSTDNMVISECMKTVTARTVNELFKEHIFVNVVTFHGGLNAIGYPWGNYVHIKHDNKATEAPDLTALQDVAKIMKSYSGSTLTTNNIKDYSTGDMVQMVMIIFIFRVIL
jgi:hypothetical protein